MAKFTFLEVHLDGASLTANAPFSGESRGEEEGPDVEVGSVGEEEGGSGKPWLGALVGLLFLVAVAVLAKKKLGGGSDPVPELDEYEE